MSKTAFQKIYERGLENSLLTQKKKKEKELQEELEAQEEKEQIVFGLPKPASIAIELSPEDIELAILINAAADNIEMQIAAHKMAEGENHRDTYKPIAEGSTKDGSEVYSGRIVGANSVFVALSHGKNIEIHRLKDLMPNMRYDGKDPWSCPSQILANGNVMDIKYADGVASVAHVTEQRQERQQELVRTRSISR